MTKASVTFYRCDLSVSGMEMKCPMCGVLVTSGETHHCEHIDRKIGRAGSRPASKKLKAKINRPGGPVT